MKSITSWFKSVPNHCWFYFLAVIMVLFALSKAKAEDIPVVVAQPTETIQELPVKKIPEAKSTDGAILVMPNAGDFSTGSESTPKAKESVPVGSDYSLLGQQMLDFGYGENSAYHNLGVSYRRFFSDRQDLQAGLSLGSPQGIQLSVATRLYGEPLGETCFFTFDCKALMFYGGGFGFSNGGKISVTENNLESIYQVSSSMRLFADFGFYNIFKDWFVLGFEFGYAIPIKGAEISHDNGPLVQSQKDKLEDMVGSGFLFSVSVGYRFN